ncbi:MAG: hypothetical protein EPN21_15260 [Methylococcaceae bacterium]|nr:MAG: hypothetical protein EPN21_15260 [Methylococcaceae bacterium]
MMTHPPFIKSLHIHKVRHLENIEIPLDENRPRHLILTGPNGSGKTSVLLAVRDYLNGVPSQNLMKMAELQRKVELTEQAIKNLKLQWESPNQSDQQRAQWIVEISACEQHIKTWKTVLSDFEKIEAVISDLPGAVDAYFQGEFLIVFFDAKRTVKLDVVNGPQKLDIPQTSPITSGTLAAKFLQFLVNQENKIGMFHYQGDNAKVAQLTQWKHGFIERLRGLFQCPELELEYDVETFNFKIHLPDREPFGLDQLSDGFSSAIQIVAELLLRMEARQTGRYDMPGVVLIDEIETHLHIELQKQILPFLTDFFPHLQFIVTSHSPFVLNSLPDAVVFDLASGKRWENLAPLSAGSIIEDYFDSDQYSQVSKDLLARYQQLAAQNPRTPEQAEAYRQLIDQLDGVTLEQAPELVAQYRHLRARERQG